MSTGKKIVPFEICKTETWCQICLHNQTTWTKINFGKIYIDLTIGHNTFFEKSQQQRTEVSNFAKFRKKAQKVRNANIMIILLKIKM